MGVVELAARVSAFLDGFCGRPHPAYQVPSVFYSVLQKMLPIYVRTYLCIYLLTNLHQLYRFLYLVISIVACADAKFHYHHHPFPQSYITH